MAYTKIIPIRVRLDSCVNYALNEEKTVLSNVLEYVENNEKTTLNHVALRSSVNCFLETAFEDMVNTKKRYMKTSGVLGYHIIQSFMPNEVSPEKAHQIGNEFANEFFGDRFEVVIATHVDRSHIHNHIVFNSVSVEDGNKFVDDFKNYYVNIRGISDSICKAHKLSVIDPEKDKLSLTYAEWMARNKGKLSWQSLIRMDINDAVSRGFSYGNFLLLMKEKGYEIKQGKYLALRPHGKERFVRTYKLGEGYCEKAIMNRLQEKDLGKELPQFYKYVDSKREYHKRGKATGFRALCIHYMYLLGMVKRNHAPQKVSLLLKEDLLKFEAMTKTFDFIKDKNLETYEDVISFKTKCKESITLLKKDKVEHKTALEEKPEIYTALLDFKIYKQAHELFEDGYTAMEDESNKYLRAKETLESDGRCTQEQIKTLQNEYSLHLDKAATYDSDIKHFQHEVRMCDRTTAGMIHVKGKLEDVEELKVYKVMSTDNSIVK